MSARRSYAPRLVRSTSWEAPLDRQPHINDASLVAALLCKGRLGGPDPAACERVVTNWVEEARREPRRQRRRMRRLERRCAGGEVRVVLLYTYGC